MGQVFYRLVDRRRAMAGRAGGAGPLAIHSGIPPPGYPLSTVVVDAFKCSFTPSSVTRGFVLSVLYLGCMSFVYETCRAVTAPGMSRLSLVVLVRDRWGRHLERGHNARRRNRSIGFGGDTQHHPATDPHIEDPRTSRDCRGPGSPSFRSKYSRY